MNGRAWLVTSWTGRSFLGAIFLKGLLVIALRAIGDTVPLQYADRVVNLALIVLASIAIVGLTLAVRARLLWRVRRKLILSYILIGAVPILLLIAFSLLAFLLILFDVSSYLVQNRLALLTEQANNLARTTLTEVERTPFEGRPDVLARRQGVLETRYPGVALAMVPTFGSPRCGAPPSKDLPAVAGTAYIIAGQRMRRPAALVPLPVSVVASQSSAAANCRRRGQTVRPDWRRCALDP